MANASDRYLEALFTGIVTSVSRSATHSFSKAVVPEITLLAGFGIEGDVHQGPTTRVRGRWARGRTKPNLCQVHLLHAELFDELRGEGFALGPGEIGENITTRGLDFLGLLTGARLHIGAAAVVEVTGLRTPCIQLDRFQAGLMAALRCKDDAGEVSLKGGIMGIVASNGVIRSGDPIRVELPPGPRQGLRPV